MRQGKPEVRYVFFEHGETAENVLADLLKRYLDSEMRLWKEGNAVDSGRRKCEGGPLYSALP